MTLVATDPFADLPNPEQARRVHDLVAKMAPAEARSFVRMLAHEGLDYDTEVNGLQINAERLQLVAKMEAQLATSAIAKAAGAQPTAAEEAAWNRLQMIRKALDLTHDELSRNAHLRRRDLQTGQFLRERRAVDYEDRIPIDDTRATALKIPNPAKAATAHGDRSLADNLSPEQLQAYRQAYLQVAALTHEYRGDPRAFLVARYEGDDELDTAVHQIPGSADPLPLNPGRVLAEARVHQLPRAQPAAVLGAVGDTKYFTDPGKGPEKLASRTREFADGWETRDTDPLGTAQPTLRRLAAGGNLAYDLTNGGQGLPPHARLAIQAGRYVGAFGEDAARVAGPPIDRAAYRYRGTERPEIDPALVNALRQNAANVPALPLGKPHPQEEYDTTMAALASRHERQVNDIRSRVGKPKADLVPVPDAVDETDDTLTRAQRLAASDQNARREDALRLNRTAAGAGAGISSAQAGVLLRQAKKARKAGEKQAARDLAAGLSAREADAAAKDTVVRGLRRARVVRGSHDPETKLHNPGPVLGYFRSQLPNAQLSALQLKSGVTPPSQGVILTDDGKAVHQSVGYGDDWYVPFNLKQLDALKGGEYIRTRSFGGLTPEDVYTGLTSGARAVTVVSHNGTFTMEFNDTFQGGRRYNDKAVRMVNRYSQLLDAVRAGDVAVEAPDPDLERQLRDEVEETTPREENRKAYFAALRAKRAQLLREPRISDQRQLEVAEKLLAEKADEGGYNDRRGDKQGVTNAAAGEELMANEAVRRIATARLAQASAAAATAQAAYDRDLEYSNAMGVDSLVDPPEPVPSPDEMTDQVREELRSQGGVGAAEVLRALGHGEELDRRINFEARRVARESQTLRLDGKGYKKATEALKEQFPYYIHQDYYEPWVDGEQGDTRDTGYVRPRHNRPAAAMVGLFDPKPTPSGAPAAAKFWADSARSQERKLVPVSEYSSSEPNGGTPGRSTGSTGSSGGGKESKAERREAAKDLVRQLHAQRAFKAGAQLVGQDVAGHDPHALADEVGFPAPLKPIFGGVEDDQLAALDDPKKAGEVESQLEGVLQYLRRFPGLLDLDEDFSAARDRFAGSNGGNGGKGDEWRHMLEYPHLDRDFKGAGAGFKPDAEPEEVKTTYGKVREIKALVDAGALPADLAALKTGQIDAAAKQLRGEVSNAEHARSQGRVDAANAIERPLKGQARGLAMAAQLKRNLKAAEERAKAEEKKRPKMGFIDVQQLLDQQKNS